MQARVLFVAGASGATGQALFALPAPARLERVPHLRPSSTQKLPRAEVFDLGDHAALGRALTHCTSVLQLIGTMRNRFSRGDTYETSDIGTTRSLVIGAKASGVDHFLLLSSFGAGRPIGAYLRAKAAAERLVRESGIAYTIFRPSALVGGERKPIPGMKTLTRFLRWQSAEPIGLDELAQTMQVIARDRSHLGEVLEGPSLWAAVRASAQAV